jgi:hypothetical protein
LPVIQPKYINVIRRFDTIRPTAKMILFSCPLHFCSCQGGNELLTRVGAASGYRKSFVSSGWKRVTVEADEAGGFYGYPRTDKRSLA